MFFAIDRNGNRVSAEGGVRHTDCICPGCGKAVIHRMGDYKTHHFAHDPRDMTVATCPYDSNKDYVNESEWHIRMKRYFPEEQREIIFKDEKTGEKHIADVYHKASNTVLEFQHSPISKTEFISRTQFHLNEGRRIAWMLDESWKNDSDLARYYKNGKLVRIPERGIESPYSSKHYRWLYRRKCVEDGPKVYQPNYSVCVYTGAEDDVFHRIIQIEESHILVSLHDISMADTLDIEDLFYDEQYWRNQEPWKSEFESIKKTESAYTRAILEIKSNPLSAAEERPFYEQVELKQQRKKDKRLLEEAQQGVNRYIESLSRKKESIEERERLDKEDWWKALLEEADRAESHRKHGN